MAAWLAGFRFCRRRFCCCRRSGRPRFRFLRWQRLRRRIDCRQKPTELALLQGTNSVAQACGAFELEFLGCFAHLGFHLRDHLAQFIFTVNLLRQHIVRGDGDVICLHNGGELHIHALDNALRGDVVGFVVGKLLGTPPDKSRRWPVSWSRS